MLPKSDSYLAGARDLGPLALGVAIYALAYGMLATQAGFSPLDVAGMGLVVFAGGSQIVATQQWLAGAGAIASVVAGLALNLRLLLITASISDVYAGRSNWRVALAAHLTTDENWALMLARRAEGSDIGYRYLVGGGFALMAAWVSATTLGAVMSKAIPDPKGLGMDFAFTAAFVAIARSLFRGRIDLIPWAVSLVVVVAVETHWLAPSWALVAGGLAGAAAAGALGDD